MCIGDDCKSDGIDRRTFLNGVTTAMVGVSLLGSTAISQPKPAETRALNDLNITHEKVTFKSGFGIIDGYLARPK
jgi:hypothetical protein